MHEVAVQTNVDEACDGAIYFPREGQRFSLTPRFFNLTINDGEQTWK